MNILFLLYLAHLLGDYPLQTNWIYKIKHKSTEGGLVHILVIFACLAVCLFPYLVFPSVWFLMITISVLHFIQDSIKVKMKSKYVLRGYVVDQILHLVVSTLAWSIFIYPILYKTNEIEALPIYTDLAIIVYFIGLIAVTFFADVTAFVSDGNDAYKSRANLKRDWVFMAKSAIVFSIVYFLLLLVI